MNWERRRRISNGPSVSGRGSCVAITCVTFLSDFKHRSSMELENLGDIAVDAQRYDEAISRYTSALSLNHPSAQGILIRRSKAFLAIGSWKQALDDANQVHRF